METETHLVVDTAEAHLLQGPRNHVERQLIAGRAPVSREKNEVVGGGEFRRRPEPAIDGVITSLELPERLVDGFRIESAARPAGFHLLQTGGDLPGGAHDLIAVGLPHLFDPGYQVEHPDAAVAALTGDVGGREKRLFVRGHDDRKRPPAAPGHHLADRHVDLVDVRAFLAIDLDVDEGLVHQRGNLWVLEALVLHHMAPVAGGITDREKDRFVLLGGFVERLRAPRIPVDGVVGVLQQVRALGVSEPVFFCG